MLLLFLLDKIMHSNDVKHYIENFVFYIQILELEGLNFCRSVVDYME